MDFSIAEPHLAYDWCSEWRVQCVKNQEKSEQMCAEVPSHRLRAEQEFAAGQWPGDAMMPMHEDKRKSLRKAHSE